MKDFQLTEKQKKLLEKKGINTLFPMQGEVAQYILNGESIGFCSPTGSGKTLAYILPLLQILEVEQNSSVLIVAPNGEITAQVSQLVNYLKLPMISSIVLSDSGNVSRQIEKLKKKKPRLIIATLKRLIELRKKKLIYFDKLTHLVLDEADFIFVGKNSNLVDSLFDALNENCQLILSSATLNNNQFSEDFAKSLLWRDFGSLPKNIRHYRYKTSSNKQEISLVKLIKLAKIDKALIFVNSTSHTSHLKNFLNDNKLFAEDFSSFKDKMSRKDSLNQLRVKKIRFIITTDSLARGIDLEEIDVINYAPARDMQSYIHRSGRTGRANSSGSCYNMTTNKNYFVMEKIAKELNLDLVDL